ncbi:hypothetical protein [Rossellomorea vietnamensis]|nr:hypothetical protein [Rossellomorea vietnamensis]
MNKKRRDELHIQLPPASSMDRFRMKVTAKNMDEMIPIVSSLMRSTPF